MGGVCAAQLGERAEAVKNDGPGWPKPQTITITKENSDQYFRRGTIVWACEPNQGTGETDGC